MGLSPIELAELIKPCYKPQVRFRSLICHDCLAPATMWYGHYEFPDVGAHITVGHCTEHPSSMQEADKNGCLQMPDHVKESMAYAIEKLEY